ncbi:MAG: phenylalanine--tRNA ligase subunit beta [Candidatus Magasanikbacteria bacterium]|nr:phenylalanine--tRNA ligase subunit beta [Candidatus Magasanikbacteria bacterium]
MLISFNWLSQYLQLPSGVTPEQVAEKLKLSTVEVEKVERLGANLKDVVVGKVLKTAKHPNADKLSVCEVDVGQEKLSVVCGGSNVKEWMLVALAKIGAKVRWHGEGEFVELKPVAIRGVDSQGMICASTEIGLGEMFPLKEEKEILNLSGRRLKIGMPLSEALNLNDAILEIDNKSLSHRPDLWGHYGIAREIGALFKIKLKDYSVGKFKKGNRFDLHVKVAELKLCPRYMAVAIDGVVVGESPAWLKQRLLAVGLRPINNIVDITNYVMLDLGQPMHAFDAASLNSKPIIVRLAKDKEEFIALDGQKHKLESFMLVIADEKHPIALAGVIGGEASGGEASGVSANTKTIIFESANFDAASVRQTSMKLGLRTDSSARFEKGLDPSLCELALAKAVELALEICPGAKAVSNVVDEAHWHLNRGIIELSMEFLQKKLGVEIKQKEIAEILVNLGFGVKIKKDVLRVTAPSWRAGKDIVIAEDLVEEIARIYGFANIPSQLPIFSISPPRENKLRNLERRAAETLVKELGYAEVYNYSFVSAAQVKNLDDDLSKYIELDNPLSKEKPFLRRHLLSNLLENIQNNLVDYDELKIFEIGKVFAAGETGVRAETNSDELLPRQDTWLEAVFVNKKDNTPFWEIRRAVEIIFQSLNLDWQIAPLDKVQVWEHPTRLALLSHNGKVVGVIHELNPMTANALGIESRVGVLKINLSKLAEVMKEKIDIYKKISIYPAMTRDIAFLVKKEISHAEIVKALSHVDQLLKKVELFDVYSGDKFGVGKKSMAYHLIYSNSDRTLTTNEVNKAHDKVKTVLKSKFGAETRE